MRNIKSQSEREQERDLPNTNAKAKAENFTEEDDQWRKCLWSFSVAALIGEHQSSASRISSMFFADNQMEIRRVKFVFSKNAKNEKKKK